MATFDAERTTTRVSVYHSHTPRGKTRDIKTEFYREVDFFGDVQDLRNARAEAEKLIAFLKEYPYAETVPLEAGWTWRYL